MDATAAIPERNSAAPPDAGGAPVEPSPSRASTRHWLSEGLRAGLFLRPRVEGRQIAAHQFVTILALCAALNLALGRLVIAGAAQFRFPVWLAEWWSAAAFVLLCWVSLEMSGRGGRSLRSPLANWFALATAAMVPPSVFSYGLAIARARDLLPAWVDDSAVVGWALYLFIWGWMLAVELRLAARFLRGWRPIAVYALGTLAVFWVLELYFSGGPWLAEEGPRLEKPYFKLSQEAMEAQQAAARRAWESIAAERTGVRDVYGLVFAPYASEDVFLRESSMVAKVLAERFDARDRVVTLVNHVRTNETLPWATTLNLRRAVDAIAQKMDRESDVLVIYLTSHGGADFKLAASHWPLELAPLTASELRNALDQAGVRNRVIAISACYSGGWIEPLAGESTLVMTAADSTHTSYGCGSRSELTFFGRAMFDEQLRKTHSFEQAFAATVPVIAQREKEAGKADGFSNPQISVGPAIREVLRSLELRLDAQ